MLLKGESCFLCNVLKIRLSQIETSKTITILKLYKVIIIILPDPIFEINLNGLISKKIFIVYVIWL